MRIGNALRLVGASLALAACTSSDNGSSTPTVTKPGAPTLIAATVGNSSATLSFSAPASDGGSAITAYVASCAPSAGGAASTATSTGSPIAVSGLTNGTRYACTVAASNSAGSGPVSGALEVTPAAPIDEASCRAFLADTPSPAGLTPLTGMAATQRAGLLADGGKIVPIGGRYYTIWVPPGFYADNSASVVFNLHGTRGYPEAEWNDWHGPLASRNHALVALHWGGGTDSADSDETVYSRLQQIKSDLARHCPTSARKHWLMGFSVGSAMSFAIMVRDAAGAKAFMRQLAVSGASIAPRDYGMNLLHPTVENARANASAVSGVKSWMYCGEQDLDHSWSMCLEMPLGQEFINSHGGSATLYRDANGSHGSLPATPTAYNDMFAYMAAN